jgi:hypothetical protein
MARNAPTTYGTSLRCWDDADAFFSTVTGIEAIAQDLYHRFTNATVLGPGGEDWGEDITRWAGMDAAKLSRRGPVLSEVATRDPRILTADVAVSATPIRVKSTLYNGTVDITCTTALGPFRRVFGFNSLTVADITNILQGEA